MPSQGTGCFGTFFSVLFAILCAVAILFVGACLFTGWIFTEGGKAVQKAEEKAKQKAAAAPTGGNQPTDDPDKPDDVIDLDPSHFKIGQVGHFGKGSVILKVVEVLNDDYAILSMSADRPDFIAAVHGDRLNDGQNIHLRGFWKVVGTKKIGDHVYFILGAHKRKI